MFHSFFSSLVMSFRFLWFSLCRPLRQQSPLFGKFSSFLLIITWSVKQLFSYLSYLKRSEKRFNDFKWIKYFERTKNGDKVSSYTKYVILFLIVQHHVMKLTVKFRWNDRFSRDHRSWASHKFAQYINGWPFKNSRYYKLAEANVTDSVQFCNVVLSEACRDEKPEKTKKNKNKENQTKTKKQKNKTKKAKNKTKKKQNWEIWG